ncbi:hypothetical protein [Streptomyces sp. NPDC003006]
MILKRYRPAVAAARPTAADDVLSWRAQAVAEDHAGRGGSGAGASTTRMSGRLKKHEDAALGSLRTRKSRLAKLGERGQPMFGA